MAKASKKTATVTTITLELTLREAQVIRALCGAAGGDPRGPRGDSDEVWEALRGVVEKSQARVLQGGGANLPDTWEAFDNLPELL